MNLLNIVALKDYLSLGRSTVYALIRTDPSFPKPFMIGEKRKYEKSKVNEWIYLKKGAVEKKPPEEISLFDLRSVQDFLKISYSTLNRLMKTEYFPKPLRINKKQLFDKEDICNWLSMKGCGHGRIK